MHTFSWGSVKLTRLEHHIEIHIELCGTEEHPVTVLLPPEAIKDLIDVLTKAGD